MTAPSLVPGGIFEIARSAGIHVPDGKDKAPIRCPFHDDRRASAFVSVNNVFYCSVCTPGRGLSAKAFAARLGAPWDAPYSGVDPMRQGRLPSFSSQQAEAVWRAARGRAQGDDCAVHRYLERRGLLQSRSETAYGVLVEGMALPAPVKWWPRAGYQLVVPLWGLRGVIANIQARTITGARPKTLFPTGSMAKGCVFTSSEALELLRGRRVERVLFAEGLTDFLALASCSPIPVIAAPGTGLAASCAGPWANGVEVYVALDNDPAGNGAVGDLRSSLALYEPRRLRRLTWPRGCRDACEVIEQRGAEGLSALLRRAIGREP